MGAHFQHNVIFSKQTKEMSWPMIFWDVSHHSGGGCCHILWIKKYSPQSSYGRLIAQTIHFWIKQKNCEASIKYVPFYQETHNCVYPGSRWWSYTAELRIAPKSSLPWKLSWSPKMWLMTLDILHTANG